MQNSPNGHLDLWAREHYKSTIITFGLTIQDILKSHGEGEDGVLDHPFGEELTFCILSHNRPTAKAFLRQIKEEFENNELLKKWFPDVLYSNPTSESSKWSENEGIVVRRQSNPREATVEAYGLVDGIPTGRHFHGLIYDDVVTEESVTTPEMMKKTADRFFLSHNVGRDGGFQRYIGTRYDSEDTYSTMLERGVAIPRIYPATDNGEAGGKSVLLSTEYLESKKLQGTYIFSCQMLQNPVPSEDAYFDMERVQRFRLFSHLDENGRTNGSPGGSIGRWGEAPDYLTIYGASDYAVTEDGGDWTVHGIFGVSPDDHIYVLDWWREQARSDTWVDAIIDLSKQYGPVRWFEEKGAIIKSVEPFLVKRMRERKCYIYRDGLASDRNKASRARSIQGRVQMGMLHVPTDTDWAMDLMLEMKRFPFTNVDDQVDVVSLLGLGLEKLYGPYVKPVLPEMGEMNGMMILNALQQKKQKKGRYA